jgi:hypothetical protein
MMERGLCEKDVRNCEEMETWYGEPFRSKRAQRRRRRRRRSVNNRKFWKELIAYFPFIRYKPQRKPEKLGGYTDIKTSRRCHKPHMPHR